jgi:hypothetical protein
VTTATIETTDEPRVELIDWSGPRIRGFRVERGVSLSAASAYLRRHAPPGARGYTESNLRRMEREARPNRRAATDLVDAIVALSAGAND